MKSASFYAAKSLKIIWTLAAVLLVLMAAAISILRYSLPYLDNHKERVHDWIANQYGIELTFGHISADWNGAAMSLSLHQVQLQQPDQSSPVELYVDETQVELDFWATILNRQIRSQRFDLKGLTLSVDVTKLDTSGGDTPVISALESLFLNQLERFSITDSQLILKTEIDVQDIDLQQVSWVNKDNRHQGVGQLRVDELANNSAFFALDLHGGNKNLKGSFYAEAEDLDLAPWVNQWVKTDYQVKKSRGNFVVWAGIEQSKVQNIQLRFFESEFAWEADNDTISAKVKSGLLSAQPNLNGWDFNLDDLLLQLGEQTWLTSWLGSLDRLGNIHIASDERFNIAPLLTLAPLVVPSEKLTLLESLSPSARINRLSAHFSPTQFKLNSEFDRLGWLQSDLIPGINDIRGHFAWQNGRGNLSLSSHQGSVQIDNLLDTNLPFRHIELQANISNQGSWNIHVPHLSIDSELVQLGGQIAYQFDTNKLSLNAQVSPLTVGQAKQLLPTNLMGKKAHKYLMRALEHGEVKGADIIWQGNPAAYPFAQNEGLFQAKLEVDNLSFAFDEDWPSLTDMDAMLVFENEQLSMTSKRANLMGVNVFDASAHIPRLAGSSFVKVNAKGRGLAPDVTEVMLAGTLANSVGKVLNEELIVEDQLSAQLKLHIPLSGKNIVVNGDVTLANNPVYIKALDTYLRGSAGNIKFENERVQVQSLIADFLQQPVSIDVSADQTSSGYQADIQVSANWQIQPLVDKHQPGLADYLAGSTDWQADVELLFPRQGYQYQVNLSSSLRGLESTLPAPFASQAATGLAAVATVEGNQQASKVDIKLGDQIRFNGIVPHKEMQFSRASLIIGDVDLVNLGLGFSINANVDELGFEDWFTTINDFVAGLPKVGDKPPLLGQPNRVYVNAKKLLIAGQKIDDLALIAKHTDEDWLLTFNSEQARADMTLAKDWLGQGIEVDADFIHLQTWQEDSHKEPQISDYQNLPPIKFSCKECKWQDNNLGQVSFTLTPVSAGMQIDELSMRSRHGNLQANGVWYIDENDTYTQVEGRFESDDFGAYLKNLGFDSGIKDSESRLDFSLNWQDAPHAFNFDSLNGDLKWNLTDGYLTELKDGGSRIFSLLSLESLVRKLSFDFRDVFAKGFFYDRMSGSFAIQSGNAYTQDSVIDGGAGEMTIVGSTDLVSQQLNYQIGFTPNVTSSLPVIVAFMVNPATAIAAFALDEALTEAKVISHVRYSVTGTIQAPIATQIGRDSKDISLPAQNRQRQQTPIEDPEISGSAPEINNG